MSLRNAGFPALAALIGTGAWKTGWVAVVPVLAAVLGFSALFSWIAWRHFRYRLGDSDIRVERGLFSKTARSVPYERIQDVSLEQALVPRLFGMVDVKLETGAGGKDEVRIRYVTAAEAEALRETVRLRKGGEAQEAETGVPIVPAAESARTLFAMDPRRLATFGLFEFSLVAFAVLGGAAQQFDFLLPFDLWDFRRLVSAARRPGRIGCTSSASPRRSSARRSRSRCSRSSACSPASAARCCAIRASCSRRHPRACAAAEACSPAPTLSCRCTACRRSSVTTGILRRRFGWYGARRGQPRAGRAKSGSHVVVPFAKMDEIAARGRRHRLRLAGRSDPMAPRDARTSAPTAWCSR